MFVRTYLYIALAALMILLVGKRAFTGTLKHAVQTAPKVQLARRFSFSSWNSNKNHPALGAALSQHLNYDGIHTGFSHYDIQVAFQPKDREEQGQNLFAHKKNGTKPKAPQYSPSGEDNLFVSHEVNGGFVACGVADGVGGWLEAGYDSLAISRELCRQMKHQFEATDGSVAPAALLQLAFDAVQKLPEVDIGGTTACLGVLTPDRKLTVANLGDLWCGVFRDYALVEETKFQTHNFNTPYQLAKIPKHIIAQAEKEGRRYIIDLPLLADSYTWQLQSGDVVMFATDGVTDNIVPGDIEVFLRDQLAPTDKPALLLADTAKTFVQEVVKVLKDPNFPLAFAQELSKLTGQRYLGGKEDDITVVVVKVN